MGSTQGSIHDPGLSHNPSSTLESTPVSSDSHPLRTHPHRLDSELPMERNLSGKDVPHESSVKKEDQDRSSDGDNESGEEKEFLYLEKGSTKSIKERRIGNQRSSYLRPLLEQAPSNPIERDILDANPIVESKHNTISEDRTIESGWPGNRLAVVLQQVNRPLPHLGHDSNQARPLQIGSWTNKGSRPSNPDKPDSAMDALRRIGTDDFLKRIDTDTFLNEDSDLTALRFGPTATFPPPMDQSTSDPHSPISPQDSQPDSNPTLTVKVRSWEEMDGNLGADPPCDPKMNPDTASKTLSKKRRRDHLDTKEPEMPHATHSTTDDKEIGNSGLREHYNKLMERMEILQQENMLLRSWIDPDSIHKGQSFFQVVYRFKGGARIYFKPPSWKRVHSEDGYTYTLSGNVLSMKEDEYLQRSSNLAFVVFKTYSSQTVDSSGETGNQKHKPPPLPDPDNESLLFVSSEMRRAISNFLERQVDFKQLFPSFDPTERISSPYLLWYCTRSAYSSASSFLPSNQYRLVKLFGDWVNANYDTQYELVNDKIRRGVITCQTMQYLKRPGDPLVTHRENKLDAFQATSWAKEKPTDSGKSNRVWTVSAWRYEFDGGFYQKTVNLEIQLQTEDPGEEIALSSLKITPLEWATPEVRQKLENRGRTYWACRKKKFVSYRGGDDVELSNSGTQRFMIDYPTYKQLHPNEPRMVTKVGRTEISNERMKVDEPPSKPEVYLFPSSIVGFDIHRKKWINLDVDQIREVDWNKGAFESLVVEEETKELVQALITNRLDSERGTDVIDDKGNGLTILLHGGPGTGKTFTAESVAELAEKPLYRVSCGDIGTQPEEVERYLESALHLGKIWDCVVLLDEADVFLQARTSLDLQRNALVTVFLRVLEYYDGILILTSNRVGMLDEAFKSRIQVSLHYPDLDRGQRHKIWWNFMTRLKFLEQPNIDFDDIQCYISDLAEETMNGRQIRNAITTARQLAKFKNRNMTHTDLKHVITVGGRFERYLAGVNEGLTDDVIAREAGHR